MSHDHNFSEAYCAIRLFISKGSVLFNKLLCKIFSIICLYTCVYVYMCIYVYKYTIYGVCGVPSALRFCGFLHWCMLYKIHARKVRRKTSKTKNTKHTQTRSVDQTMGFSPIKLSLHLSSTSPETWHVSISHRK